MRVAVALGGTDRGESGIGVYVRAVLPRLVRRLRDRGDQALAVGTAADLGAYAPFLGGAGRLELPSFLDRPGASALFHLLVAGPLLRARADVLLLPAANRRLCLVAPMPTVAVVHDLAQLHVVGKYDAARQVYVREIVTRALRSATRLLAVSGATKDDLLAALSIPPQRVSVVWNGVDHERFVAMPDDDARVRAAREALGIGARPYVLYASRLEHPGKNHLRLLRAYAGSRAREGHALVLAGKDWGAREAIAREAERLGLGADLHMVGFVPDAHLPGLVAGASAVCMVGLREGFGLPALEALCAARPVFVADAGALPEVVGPLGALCDPLDEGSIRAALDRAVFDEDLRARARREGPTWGRAHGWDATAAGVVEAIDGALEP